MDESSPGAGRRVVAAGVLAAMVAALVLIAGREPATVEIAAVTPAVEPAATGADTVVPAVNVLPGPAPTVPNPDLPPLEPPPAPTPGAPSFDVVRVSPDGSALVAGRASPGAVVTILADEAPLASAEADAEGNFVAIFRADPAAGPQALTLESGDGEGGSTSSDDVVMLLPAAPTETASPTETAEPEATAEEVAAVAPEPAEQAAVAEDADAAGEERVETPAIAATAILRSDAVEATPTGGPSREVTLASISYADAGEVTLAGIGTAGAMLRVYVDDDFAREASVGEDGRWTMELGDVEEGVYRLRIDQLGTDGKVASRVETPFQRDFPQPVHRPGAGPAGTVTVQPGHNLWTLARLRYGSGVMYTQIFTANRDQIRDPDLIYPGQIFNMPEVAAE